MLWQALAIMHNVPTQPPDSTSGADTALDLEGFVLGLNRLWQRSSAWVDRNGDWLSVLGIELMEGYLLEKSGWLPFFDVDVPADIIEDPEAVSAFIEKAYRDQWPAARAQFESAAARIQLITPTTEIFRQALDLHEAGHYRAVCCMIFPQIERVLRREYNVPPEGRMAQLRPFRDSLMSAIPLRGAGNQQIGTIWLFKILESHLFEHVDNEADLARFTASPIPNRHACIHGLVDYNSYQSSINSLIIATYVLATASWLSRKPLD